MALAAVGAAAVLDAGFATAKAATSVSRFAGTYVGRDPRGWYPSWTVTIASGGQISSSFSYIGDGGRETKGSLSGQVGNDGSYSLTVHENGFFWNDRLRLVHRTGSYDSAGTMVLDTAGNIVGTQDGGNTFTWLRQ
jgi:hypothetical protein